MNYFLDPYIIGNEKKYIQDAIESGFISSYGKYLDKFEDKLSKFTGSKYVILTTSGTSALTLLLKSYNIGIGDEVIVPNLTFGATANAVIAVGATPVLVDINKDTWNLDHKMLDKSVNPKTKAVIFVSLFGSSAGISDVLKFCKKKDLLFLEDSAESFGTFIKNKHSGTIGQGGILSFYGNKTITTGEGGALLLNCENIFNKAKILQNHGMDKNKRYWHIENGYNFRMSNLQAAVGLGQIENAQRIINKKKEIYEWYSEEINLFQDMKLQEFGETMINSTPWVFTALSNKSNEIQIALKYKFWDTRSFFFPLNETPAFKNFSYITENNVSNTLAYKGVIFPSSCHLSRENINEICNIIKSVF